MGLEQVKAEISKFAKITSSTTQSVWDMYFFEHFLYRIAKSEYISNFVFKGGFLLETILGIQTRSTTDIDLKSMRLDLSNDELEKIFKCIASIDLLDDITYEVTSVSDIKKESKYKGKTIRVSAKYYNIRKSFSVDVATGDTVTPNPIKLLYSSKINDLQFKILAYSNETILAEKFETLVSRGLNNSRAKDLLDIYLLVNVGYDEFIFNAAIINTFYTRGTRLNKENLEVVEDVLSSERIKELFEHYCKRHSFSKNVTFEECKKSIRSLLASIHLYEKINLGQNQITLIRHGQDERNKLGGWSDNKLTDEGIKEVVILSKELSEKYDLIISSDLPRAFETAKIISEYLGLELILDPELRETNNGLLKNLTLEEFNIKYPGLYFSTLKMDQRYPNGESPNDFYVRIKEAFIKIINEYQNKNVLIVTHGGVITVINCLINGWEYSNLLKITIPTATTLKLK